MRSLNRTSGNHFHHHDKDKEAKPIELESPTSISMKNSFIIKNADPSFDSYYNSMKKRKSNLT